MITVYTESGVRKLQHNDAEPVLNSLQTCIVYESAFTQDDLGNYDTVTFDTDLYDPDDLHSTSSNTDRITIPSSEPDDTIWIVTANISWSTNNTGVRWQRIEHISSAGSVKAYCEDQYVYAATGGSGRSSVRVFHNVDPDDFFRLRVMQSGAASLNCSAVMSAFRLI